MLINLSRLLPDSASTATRSLAVVFVLVGLALLANQGTVALAQTAATIQDITWTLGPNYPTPIKGGAAGIVNNTLVYAGGEQVPDTPTHDSNLTYGFQLGGTAWTSCRICPRALHTLMRKPWGMRSTSPADEATSSPKEQPSVSRRTTAFGNGARCRP